MSLRGRYILEAPGPQGLNHIECGLRYVPLCGTALDPAVVERVPYTVADEGWAQSHTTFCKVCTQVLNRRAVARSERA